MVRKKKQSPLVLFFLYFFLLYPPSLAVDLLFNGFDPSDLALFANATLEGRYLSLTNASAFSLGRALYKPAVPARRNSTALPFSASFIFSIAPIPGVLPGHGLAFLFAPAPGTLGGTSSQNLGLFNLSTNGDPTDRVLAVEFDVFENPEFRDINANHVGIDRNSLTSLAAYPAGFWPDDSPSSFVNLTLNDGSNYQAWIEYSNGQLNVSMAPASLGRKPKRPLISMELDLSDLFLDEMWLGFCAATGRLVQRHRVLAWSFSNSNFSLSEALVTSNLPNFVPSVDRPSSRSRGLVVGVSVAAVILFVSSAAALGLVWRKKKGRKSSEEEEGSRGEEVMEDWEVEYWPHRIGYKKILSATEGFSEQNLIGCGGNGRVYKGVMGGTEVAVKLFTQSTKEDAKQFLAEVSTLGRLKHRNLVGLRGWCRARRPGGSDPAMLLVYDYMENGSLDKWIFGSSQTLDWPSRVRVLRDVAAAVLYLHEGLGKARVLHRDIKANNVLLDRNMAGRLGDFGLARVHPHGHALGTTRVVGSAGYIAPELVRTGRASAETDVYAYGVLVLEVACGRIAAEEGHPPLVLWARKIVELGEAVDPRARGTAGFEEDEAERVVRVGLACTRDDPAARPTMRKVVRALELDRSAAREGVGESAEAWLLDARLRTMTTVLQDGQRGTECDNGRGGANRHLTFEEIRQSMSSSTSRSGSDVIIDGR